MITKKHKAWICTRLAQPRWHILNVNQESDLQRFEQETDKPKNHQNQYLIAYLRQAIRGQRKELKLINLTGIFN